MGVELKKEIKNPKTRIRALFYLARYYRQFYQWKKALKYYKKYIRESKFVGGKNGFVVMKRALSLTLWENL